MPHREPINVQEFSKELFTARDSNERRPEYPSKTNQEVTAELSRIQKAYDKVKEAQRSCNHLRAVINLPARRVHQCQDCGLIRDRAFGQLVR